jgi:hypothetical protein
MGFENMDIKKLNVLVEQTINHNDQVMFDMHNSVMDNQVIGSLFLPS